MWTLVGVRTYHAQTHLYSLEVQEALSKPQDVIRKGLIVTYLCFQLKVSKETLSKIGPFTIGTIPIEANMYAKWIIGVIWVHVNDLDSNTYCIYLNIIVKYDFILTFGFIGFAKNGINTIYHMT